MSVSHRCPKNSSRFSYRTNLCPKISTHGMLPVAFNKINIANTLKKITNNSFRMQVFLSLSRRYELSEFFVIRTFRAEQTA